MCDLYARDEIEWRKRVTKSQQAVQLLQELESIEVRVKPDRRLPTQIEETSQIEEESITASVVSRPATVEHKVKSHKKRPAAVKASKQRSDAVATDMQVVKRLRSTRLLSQRDLDSELQRLEAERSGSKLDRAKARAR
jgi:hypothetical protein